ncbi:DUF3016 domain-containing protein [Glaciecola sp. KUL10]|jgi:hypothetical protein|uniref:DUF3016 domain-containing protein n=1 Tax=Glaciecola sp. (strain KUL10) TaxID=2161813 RepID=UPI000D786060|nr:DUF3016 domain-containing protein [Glaciecola sp. KUL10]
MKNSSLKLASFCLFYMGVSTSVLASESVVTEENKTPETIEVVWQDAEKFRDVRPVNEGRKRFRERVLQQLEAHIVSKGDDLPSGQSLKITVSDVDLAGQVWPMSFVGMGQSGGDVRLIKDIDIPRMDLSYELMDQSGQVLKSDTVKLKDMAFLQSSHMRYRNDHLRHEKKMLDDWFKRTFVNKQSNS